MAGITFNHPGAFWFIAALPLIAAVGWWTRAGLRPRARIITICVRTFALLLGITALADPVKQIPVTQTASTKIYLLRDRSQSIGNDVHAAEAEQAIMKSLKPTAHVQELSFAGGIWQSGQAPLEPDQTDIAKALDTIGGAAGDRNGEQIVLLTDGRSTRGVPTDAAMRLAMRGVHVNVIPVGMHINEPLHFVDIQPPLGARVGVASGVRVTLSADTAESATIRLLDASRRVVDERVIPFPGKPTLILHFTSAQAGRCDYSVEADVAGKAADARSVPVYVEGPPRILLVDNVPAEASPLAAAIAPLHMPVDLISADQFPDDLTPYAEIILSDLSGKEFSPRQRGAIHDFVESGGGGLIFVGGDNTVAARWNANPLRALLPVTLEEKPAKVMKKLPDVSVVFVLDCSGSMNESLPGTTGNVSKLEMVKAATIASLQAMPETARIAVIAFEATPHIIVPPTPIDHRQEIGTQVDGIACGGGTLMYPAIAQGIKILSGMSGTRYLIVLTDGDSEPPPAGASWNDLSRSAVADGISWTSIGVGTDADEKLLRGLATGARGRYAFCGTGDQIPQVFVERAREMRRISEKKQPAFTPLRGPDLGDLPAIKLAAFPPLEGSDPAERRPSSRLLLLTDKHEPLLASWQFGAGKVFAFCSDAKNLWARAWIDSPLFSKFWEAIAGAVARPHEPLVATVRQITQGNHVSFLYRVRDQNGRAIEELQPHVSISPPIAAAPIWEFPEPGEYEISLDLPADRSSHTVDVLLRGPQYGTLHHCSMVTGGTTTELSATGPDISACEEIAAAGGGICSADPAAIAAAIRNHVNTDRYIIRQPLWPWLVAAMICLWPIDVLLRKIL